MAVARFSVHLPDELVGDPLGLEARHELRYGCQPAEGVLCLHRKSSSGRHAIPFFPRKTLPTAPL
jgi:hypothetical protein